MVITMTRSDVATARQIVRATSTQHERNTAFETLHAWTDGGQFTADMRACLIAYRKEWCRVNNRAT